MEAEASKKKTEKNKKIIKILNKLLDPYFQVKNDDNFNKFLTHLACKNDEGNSRSNPHDKELSEQYCQWISSASTLWDRSEIKPHMTILSFTLNLTSQLSSDEQIFVNLNSGNVYESLVGIAQTHTPKDPNVILGVVTLFCSFLEHKSGVQWVMATTHWMEVTNLGLKARTIYIRNKAYQFVKKLLEKTICFNRNFAVNLIRILLKPINDIYRSLSIVKDSPETEASNEEHFETLKPTLEFISELISMLLKTFNAKVIQLFIEQNAPELIEQLLLTSRGEDLRFELLKVQFVFLFYKLCVKLEGVKVVSHDSLSINDIQIMFALIKNEMDKNNVKCVIRICDYAHSLYCSLVPRMPLSVREGEVIEFQNQMVLFQLMPILVLSVQIIRGKNKHPDYLFLNDEFRKSFIQKLMKLAAYRSLEICYKWKEKLQVKLDLMEDATFSLQYIVRTKNLLNKERASTIFPSLVYSLRDSLTIIKSMVNIDWTPRATQFVCTLVDSIVIFVESFNLTWNDSIETIRVMDLAVDFLEYRNWSEKIIVIKGLKLLNTAISRYMCPDMVLLIYSTKNSTVFQSGSLLYDKCHDGCWEIRDSALEVVYTLSSSANTKFPALTNVLLDAELPQLVVYMALNDEEYTVRTTAIRCLQELIQIPDISNVLLGVDKFLENMLSVFENEDEGIVRREAATLISYIYREQHFPDELLLRLYDVMTFATLEDPYWEVKYNALDFWAVTWKTLLTNQGMIDKIFPSHTFSKELKKIVALNETEIKKRIIKVLNQLSQIGCLYVLKYAVLDSHVEVATKAMDMTQKVQEFFQKYKIPSDIVDLNDKSNPPTRRKDSRYEQLFEPLSPASSTTMTAFSPADLGNPYSPQFDHVQDLEYPPPFSPVRHFNRIPPTGSPNSQDTQSGSSSLHFSPSSNPVPLHPDQTSAGVSSHHDEVLVQATVNPVTDSLYYTSLVDQISSDITPICEMFDVDMLGVGGDVNFEDNPVHYEVNPTISEPTVKENVLHEFLKINDQPPVQEVYNPPNPESSSPRRTKQYLAPADYVKFVYKEAEAYAANRKLGVDEMDEFESVLDNILKGL